MAFSFASDTYDLESAAWICRKTGKIYWGSSELDDEVEIPDDVGDSSLYASVSAYLRCHGYVIVHLHAEAFGIVRRPARRGIFEHRAYGSSVDPAWPQSVQGYQQRTH